MNTGDRRETNCHQGHGDSYFIVGWCAVEAAKRIEPNVFLLILLPPLIYESASKIDWFVFKRSIIDIVYLAFPGVVVSSFGIALIFLAVDSSGEWGFFQALTLGSILAATGFGPRFCHQSTLPPLTHATSHQLSCVVITFLSSPDPPPPHTPLSNPHPRPSPPAPPLRHHRSRPGSGSGRPA